MRFFVKAVATGFAMSMGSALFKKVSKKMGLDGDEPKTAEKASQSDLADSGLDGDESEHGNDSLEERGFEPTHN